MEGTTKNKPIPIAQEDSCCGLVVGTVCGVQSIWQAIGNLVRSHDLSTEKQAKAAFMKQK